MRSILAIPIIAALLIAAILIQVETQHFIDADRDAATGYGKGYEYVIRPSQVLRVATERGLDGGWGPIADVTVIGMAYATETYLDGRRQSWVTGYAFAGPAPVDIVAMPWVDVIEWLEGDYIHLADVAVWQNAYTGQ